MKTYAVILASGTGNRFGGEKPKQFAKIGGRTILERSVDAFEKINEIDSIILVVTPEYKELAADIVQKNNYKKISKILGGGKLRKDSSSIGINSIKDNEANVLIHDCARPLVSERIIKECIEALQVHDAVGVAVPSTDTIIEVKDSIITDVPKREYLMRIQTPQCFKLSLIKKAHEISKNDKDFTDDCGLIVKYDLSKVYVVNGDIENIKITYPEDICLAEKFLEGK